MSLNSIVELIKEGKFEILIQNAEEYLKCMKSGKDVEHIFGVCSHFIYNAGNISKDNLSSLAKMVILYLQQAMKNLLEFSSIIVLKSLYYILVHGVRKGLDIPVALELVNEIESLIKSCEEFSLNHSDLLKKMHSTLWNASLQKGILSAVALSLQSHALGFLSLATDSLHDSCIFTYRVGKLADHNKCPVKDIESLYKKILTNLIANLNRKPEINTASVIALNQILIEFGRILYVAKRCNEFSKVFKPLVLSLESLCDLKVILSLKMNVKIVEVGMAFASSQSNEETLLKYLSGCSVVSKSSAAANAILVDGLYFVYHLFQEENISPKVSKAASAVFRCIMERIKPESNFSNDSLLRILDIYGTHLNSFVTRYTANIDDKESLITEAGECSSALANLMAKVESLKGEIHVYNIGINCSNLGVITFKKNNYNIASKLLDFGLQYLHANYSICNDTQKNSIMSIMKKKAFLLKDSLRYSGKYREAATKTLHMIALKILPQSELMPTWIKCKRDAHKTNCLAFKKICLIDIFNEVESELSDYNKLDIKVEELLLDEIRELEQLGFDTYEEVIRCATVLMNSDDIAYSLEGSLSYAKMLWSNPENATEKLNPIKLLKKALHQIEKNFSKGENGIALEYKARIAFWMYLCNLQIVQEKAELEVEETLKENEPLTVQSTDLGEEVQPNDVCSVRPSTTVNTFDCQEHNFKDLHQALDYWEHVVKGKIISKPSVACSDLMSIGFIYKLTGVLPSSIKAFTLLLNVANLHNFEEFWIKGVVELIDIIPELLSIKVAQKLLDLLKSDESRENPKLSDFVRLSTLSSVAYLYFRKGQFSTGAELINKCLSSPLLEKRTPSATEVQIGIYLVASHYAFLPKSLLSTDLKPKENCLFLALSATRKAIGLANASADCNSGNVCWRHKVAWLHHISNMWLGRLCYITAQPRLARAYLRQALTLAEKFALPLRTAELFCTLSEIDLQCDQLDDCRVKIDSLDFLLKIHSVETKDAFPLDKELKKDKISLRTTFTQMELKNSESIYADGEISVDENMRDSKVSPGFMLPVPTLRLDNQLPAHGVKKGINELLQQNFPPSPGLGSEQFVVRSIYSCPKRGENCSVCFTPELHAVSVRANVLMGVIYAQRDDENGSRRCFSQAQKDLEQTLNLSSEIVLELSSILRLASTTCGIGIVNDNQEETDQFIPLLMSQAYISLLFNHNEVLCLNFLNWDSMKSKALETLKRVNEQSSMILTLNHPLVLQLILQCHAISKTIQNREEKADISPIEADCSPLKPSKIEAISFKTPLKSCVKKRFNHLVPTPNNQAASTPFRIYTDDSASSGERKKLTRGARGRKEKEIKNLASSFGKLSVETKTPYCKLNFSGTSTTNSPRFSPLSSQNKSPFSQVLELPSKESIHSVNSGNEKSTRVTQTKLKKLVSKNSTNNKKEENPSSETKENSPIIKIKLPQRRKPCTAQAVRTATDAASSATTSTRETRSKRNLKRL